MTTPVLDGQASFALRTHNPDVLTCIANLSNDEVFTPPDLADRMLDTVAGAWAEAHDGAEIWQDRDVTFLDPFTKSGVFLREIVARLTEGLAEQIPDLQERVDHILTKQVFGIGITQLTALLARRSVYCSKDATGPHSVAKSFDRGWGNIWFERTEHTWAGEKCAYCGASKEGYERDDELESHAYAFIHTTDPRALLAKMFGVDVQFDVIIGNPPYQLDDGGYGTSAAPIYQEFVARAKQLEPRYLSLVIPSRWFAGGKGLDGFREEMLTDDRLRVLQDYWLVGDAFPGVALQGGVLYFLWARDERGDCMVTSHFQSRVVSEVSRPLLEPGADIFIRYNESIPILQKIVDREGGEQGTLLLPPDKRFTNIVSPRKPFGLDTKYAIRSDKREGDRIAFGNGGPGYKTSGRGYVADTEIRVGRHLIEEWKVFIGGAYGDRGGGGASRDAPPKAVLGRPFVGPPGSVSTETYICLGPVASESEAENLRTYLSCKLTRFLVMLHKPSQHATQKVYTFVPIQDFGRAWTDADLYSKYALTEEEIAFVEWMIRPMELGTQANVQDLDA